MNRNLPIALLLLALTVAGHVRKASAETDGSAKLRALEAEFVKATAEHGLDGFMSYFAEDAGKANIRKSLEPWGPDVNLTWTPVQADMAASRDLGYTFGNYVFKAKDKDGHPVVQYGKYATVWKKQKDSSWKVVMDMGNSSPDPAKR